MTPAEELQQALEIVRRRTLLVGERKYVASDVLSAVVDYFQRTKPSELFVFETGSGKERATSYAIPEPQIRELWQKWVDAVKDQIYGVGFRVPELLLRDVIAMFETANNNGANNAQTEKTSPG